MLRKNLMIMVVFYLAMPVWIAAADSPPAGPRVFLPESVYEFRPVVEGTAVEHDFILQNQGDAPLEVIDLKSG